jgi:hypothetical protein
MVYLKKNFSVVYIMMATNYLWLYQTESRGVRKGAVMPNSFVLPRNLPRGPGEKQDETLVRTTGLQAEIWAHDFQNTKHEY